MNDIADKSGLLLTKSAAALGVTGMTAPAWWSDIDGLMGSASWLVAVSAASVTVLVGMATRKYWLAKTETERLRADLLRRQLSGVER